MSAAVPPTVTHQTATPAGDRSTLRRLGTVPALDGVRGLAVLLVMMVHLQLLLPFEQTGVGWIDGFIRGGYLGVDLFFVLSGFLITALLLQETEERGGVIRYGAFYIRRALRLLPALYVLLAAYVVYVRVADVQSGDLWITVRSALLYMSNWQVVIDETTVAHELTHLWSLAIEEQFYLWWPAILVVFLGPRRSARTVGLAIGAAIVGVALWRAWLLHDGTFWTELTVRTDTRVDALLIGALLASLWVRRATPSGRWVDAMGWVGLVGVIAAVATFRGPDDVGYQGGLTLVALGTAAVVLALVNGTWRGRWLFELAPLRAVGRVSYGVYLWHYPIFYIVAVEAQSLPDLERVTLALVLTTFAVLGSWYLVERPALRLKTRFGAHTAPTGDRTPPMHPAPVPLPWWDREWGRLLWGSVAVVAMVGTILVARAVEDGGGGAGGGAQPDGLDFPSGDVDRVGYWGLVDLEPTLLDNFARVDSPTTLDVADTGQQWTVANGTWGTVYERAVTDGPTPAGPALAVLQQADRDGLTEVTIMDAADGAGLVVRYVDPGNYWSVVMEPTRQRWVVSQVIDGRAIPAGEFTAPTDDGVTVSVTQNDATIRFLVDGVDHLTLLDPPLPPPWSGGLIATDPAAAGATWDRYLILRFEPGAG